MFDAPQLHVDTIGGFFANQPITVTPYTISPTVVELFEELREARLDGVHVVLDVERGSTGEPVVRLEG